MFMLLVERRRFSSCHPISRIALFLNRIHFHTLLPLRLSGVLVSKSLAYDAKLENGIPWCFKWTENFLLDNSTKLAEGWGDKDMALASVITKLAKQSR